MHLPLDGDWQFRKVNTSEWLPATVPGCVHTDLMRAGRIPDPFYGSNELDLCWIEHTDFEYRREFKISSRLLGHRKVELVADGLDTLAVISINGTIVAETDNMFIGYRFDIKNELVPGVNHIVVRFKNPMQYLKRREGYPWFDQPNDPVGGAAGIRKMQCSFGWDWGPRLPTCGIYRSIRIETSDHPRITHVSLRQQHSAHAVVMQCTPETDLPARRGYSWRYTIALNGKIVDKSFIPRLTIRDPQHWWPNGQGDQPLYQLTVELLHQGTIIDTLKRHIGLRTIKLDCQKDTWGESFRFLVNGVPVYAKGASWVPAHAFPSFTNPGQYRNLIRSAAEANFNLLRVWGGGIYEGELFYDLCDEYGIMVWHDFMFACSLYPGDERFVQSVSDEAHYQTRRLAHRACMALWCGNNELEQYYRHIIADPHSKTAYERIFYDMLPKTVRRHAAGISYWPSSPHNPDGYEKGPVNERAGDAHYWDVWHARLPPEASRKHRYRFWSEFGMQAYCSVDTALQFTDANNLNVFGPAMENHQKHPAGNAIILQYIAARYRFPKYFAALSYISQVNQAYCIGTMVEHQRRCMPQTMGSLYWQLNDCWPVFSWSGIDFGGEWKGLHYAARRFYAPAMITFELIGEEHTGKINRHISTVSGVRIFTVYDGPKTTRAMVQWDIYDIGDGSLVLHGGKTVTLRRNESIMCKELDLARLFCRIPKERIAMRLILTTGTTVIATNTVLFTAPRFIELPRTKIITTVTGAGSNRFTITFRSTGFKHQVAFHLPQTGYRASDNFFDLFPGVPHEVTVAVEGTKKLSPGWIKKRLQVMSVAESYR